MASTTLQDLADRLIDGGLEGWLRRNRTAGLSLDALARKLDQEHDIVVTPETVRTWCRYYGIPTSRRAA